MTDVNTYISESTLETMIQDIYADTRNVHGRQLLHVTNFSHLILSC